MTYVYVSIFNCEFSSFDSFVINLMTFFYCRGCVVLWACFKLSGSFSCLCASKSKLSSNTFFPISNHLIQQASNILYNEQNNLINNYIIIISAFFVGTREWASCIFCVTCFVMYAIIWPLVKLTSTLVWYVPYSAH